MFILFTRSGGCRGVCVTSALETFGVSQDSVPRMISGCVLSIRFASSAVFPTTEIRKQN